MRTRPTTLAPMRLVLALTLTLFLQPATLRAETDGVRYTGSVLSDPYRHDGGLAPAVGVHNIQLMRAHRDSLTARCNYGWTYNHQPMMCHWQGRFYVHFLCDSVSEHVPPSRTMLMTSADGYRWTEPEELFPPYRVPDGTTKPGVADTARQLGAVMHQRFGFFTASDGRLLASGNYGIALHPKDDPNDGNGIGRVVREIKADGQLGPIYFVYYNHGFGPRNTDFPHYTRSGDRGLRAACREMMAHPLWRMQMVEEADRHDPMLPLDKTYKAFCHYELPDGRTVGLWKHALTAISADGGETWPAEARRAPGFVNSNAKIWGQRLTDGTYATVYNPSEFRWPLAISLSTDGLEYTTLNLVHGTVPPMRYGGGYKSFGPQYVRGIQPGNGTPPDGDLWVTYSVGKEDIWVSHIPVPVREAVTAHVDDDIACAERLADLREWNLTSGLWTPVGLEERDGTRWLTLSDRDPFAYALAERIVPASRELHVEFDLVAEQADYGNLQIDVTDRHGTPCARLELADSLMRAKGGARYARVAPLEAGRTYHVEIELSAPARTYTIYIDGRKQATRMMFAPVHAMERIVLRTGSVGSVPTPDTPADQDFDLPGAGGEEPLATFRIAHLRTRGDRWTALATPEALHRCVARFNAMEPETTVQAIPNDSAAAWMERNMPLFECPDRQLTETYYFRWWTLRKHLIHTPVGWGMTEFLVPRKYADRYNLISSALGHHLHEARWLRDTAVVQQIARTWYRGNDGRPMERMRQFSSWTPYAVWQAALATGDTAHFLDLLPDIQAEYAAWEADHRLPSGLYWQSDVNDAMEESISGGRKKQYARPTISSYMYGNAMAIAHALRMAGNAEGAARYEARADTLRRLVETLLWSERDQFFETRRGDTLAAVREAIGFVPWYFGLPSSPRFDVAWRQLTDPEGFDAPAGLTTAERRHPQFRAFFRASCEWNGPVWPFATSQTLTALARYLHGRPDDAEDGTAIGKEAWLAQLLKYARAHTFHGLPYIGEYHDEVTGYWLKGDAERSRYYNHSTFADLIVTGLVGLCPHEDDTLEIDPLLPEGMWAYFCLDGLRYHGHDLTVAWDADGSRYRQGRGLSVWVDGRLVARRETLGRLRAALKP